jgi:hypothetical protein
LQVRAEEVAMGGLALVLLSGCGMTDDPCDDCRTNLGDADADTDTDADADSDADVDVATAETGVAPTGETGTASCVGAPSDLVPVLEVRDPTGAACTSCSGVLTLAAGFANPCAADVVVELDPLCFVTSWSITSPTADLGLAGCVGGSPTATTVVAGGALEQTAPVGTLTTGNWRARAVIVTATDEHVLEEDFSVP